MKNKIGAPQQTIQLQSIHVFIFNARVFFHGQMRLKCGTFESAIFANRIHMIYPLATPNAIPPNVS